MAGRLSEGLLATKLSKRNVVLDENLVSEALAGNAAAVAGTVIRQDPPPGTLIPRGGGVTLTIARARNLPVKVIEGASAEFENKLIGEVYDELIKVNPPSVLELFQNVDEYSELNEVQRQQVDQALQKAGVGAGPAAFKGAQGVLELGGIG